LQKSTRITLPPSRSDLREDVRFRMMRLLEDKPDMSQRELSDALGVSLGATHYCLNALAKAGLVKIRNFANSGYKGRYAYFLTPAGVAEKTTLTQRFLRRKWQEYAALREEIEALEKEIGSEHSFKTARGQGQ
jgi:MarR family transcriptional regulator, temperature-dependent positive regulator of motility